MRIQDHPSIQSKALFLLILLGIIWGSGYTIAKFVMQTGVPPLAYSFWQSLGPALFLSGLHLTNSKPKRQLKPHHGLYFLLCGLVGIAIPNSTMYFTAKHLPAGMVAVIVNTVPILTYPLALLAKEERFVSKRMAAVVLGFIGIFLIINHNSRNLLIGINPWAALTLLSPLCFACCSVYIAKYQPKNLSSLTSSAGMLIASALLLSPMIILSGQFYPLTPPFDSTKLLILLEIALSSLGYVLFFYLVRLAGPVFYSLVGGIVAITGLAWGYFIFDEQLSLMHYIAVSLILYAIISLTPKPQTKVNKAHDQSIDATI